MEGLNKIIKKKIHPKPHKLVRQSLFKQFQQIHNIFLVFYWNFNPFAPCTPFGATKYGPTFGQQSPKKERVNNVFEHILKEYSTSFLVVCRLIDFARVLLKLFMFKVCVIIGISKIEFFNFCGTEKVKQNQKI